MKNFLSEFKNEDKNINEQRFRVYLRYQDPSFLVKDLSKDNQIKSDTSVKYLNESLVNSRNTGNSKQVPENENSKKVISIIEKVLDFNNQQNGKQLKI